MISKQINKESSISERRYDRFSAQNGKDEPNHRAAKVWQKNNKENDKEK
jgi:hypothetical protein